MIGIYKIKNKVNGKVYIGQSIRIEKRWIDHKKTLRSNSHRNIYLQNAWNKYGEENFIHEIIEECDISELNDKEIYWIKYYNSTDSSCGYNLDKGGGCNKEISDITREKLSISHKGENNSQSHSVICLETKEVFTTIKQANDKYDIPKSVISSCCRKKRKVANGLHWMYYEDYLNSTKKEIEKIINNNPISHCVKVMNITTNCIYNSIQEASDITGICRNQISKCCRGIGSTAGGYKWEYVKEAV